jgi:hypothetical protein
MRESLNLATAGIGIGNGRPAAPSLAVNPSESNTALQMPTGGGIRVAIP